VKNVVVPKQTGNSNSNSNFKTNGKIKQKNAENEKHCNLYSSPIARTFKMKGVR
jgi:hypothetical protein